MGLLLRFFSTWIPFTYIASFYYHITPKDVHNQLPIMTVDGTNVFYWCYLKSFC
ncbi:hypothetical protein PANI_CDS0008 [Maribacter phage Panino]